MENQTDRTVPKQLQTLNNPWKGNTMNTENETRTRHLLCLSQEMLVSTKISDIVKNALDELRSDNGPVALVISHSTDECNTITVTVNRDAGSDKAPLWLEMSYALGGTETSREREKFGCFGRSEIVVVCKRFFRAIGVVATANKHFDLLMQSDFDSTEVRLSPPSHLMLKRKGDLVEVSYYKGDQGFVVSYTASRVAVMTYIFNGCFKLEFQ